MLLRIERGTLSAGSVTLLEQFNFTLSGSEHVAIVGPNGCGKTTFLRLLAGKIELDRTDAEKQVGLTFARKASVAMLEQTLPKKITVWTEGGQSIGEESTDENLIVEKTVDEMTLGEFLADYCNHEYHSFNTAEYGKSENSSMDFVPNSKFTSCEKSDALVFSAWTPEHFAREQEISRFLLSLGFESEDRKKKMSEFSGGERTKISLISVLLQKPDILLLDEPTNHLDAETTEWLEEYINKYPGAVVVVSHDRYFLDRVASSVWEIHARTMTKYTGGYTAYRKEKQKNLSIQEKAYRQQQEEITRLEELIKKFKNKPTKAAFARSRKKILERMEKVEKPEALEAHIFAGEIVPNHPGPKWMLDAKDLEIGYEKGHPILPPISLRIRRGQKIGIIGPNGIGKTTFLKTAHGSLSALKGSCILSEHVDAGYFDQLSSGIESEKTVLEHFHDLFPSMLEKDARSVLASFLFSGRDAAKKVSDLSGGEKSRLLLAELLQQKPNMLILDEPTNHMDIPAKETLESAFRAYTGTMLFISHDRYFIKEVADNLLVFQEDGVYYYPFGYDHYREHLRRYDAGTPLPAQIRAEDEALISGLKAVPEKDRGYLREQSTEEAHLEWLMKPLGAEVLAAGEALELHMKLQDQELYWTDESYAKGWDETYALLEAAYTKACLKWHDTYYDADIQRG